MLNNEHSKLYSDELILEVKNLEVTFTNDRGKKIAVSDINFEIHRGETLGIVGESGSGKSVTSLAIMQLIQAPAGQITNGEIIFHGKDGKKQDLTKISEIEMHDIRGGDIAMIFQEPMTSLNPVYTCGDQVMEAIFLHQKVSKKEAKQRTLELFERVKFKENEILKIFKSYPHEISGGQKQRVMIAMALSCEPSLLICDEPTTALDVTVQKAILELLNELRAQNNMSMLFITHDLGVMAEIADTVMVMYRGKVLEKNIINNIFDNPKSPYTKGLLACRPRLELQLKTLPVVSDFMEVSISGEILEKEEAKKGIGGALMDYMTFEDEIEERNKLLAAQTPILELRNIKKYYPIRKGLFGGAREYKKAVDDVSFVVYPGETVGLVGESGCGKSTLGHVILRLKEATGGEIFFEGRNINNLSGSEMRKLRREMQIVFQDPYSSLNPRMTVGKAIMEPMQIHKVLNNDQQRRLRAIEIMEKVGLAADQFNKYPHEFSGGQKQRICIARALSINPKFIIADESVSALDVSVQAQVLNLLNSLKEEFNLTYIFISHDLSVVKFMSDRIIVMNNGKIEEIDYAEEIYDKPQTEYTKTLLAAIPQGRGEDVTRAQMNRAKLIAEAKLTKTKMNKND